MHFINFKTWNNQVILLKKMKVNMEPKTIEEFRDLTKVLKLKVMKQAQTIQAL